MIEPKKWKIVNIDEGFCQITYSTRNSENERIFYCLQDQGIRDGIRLMRCTQDHEPQNAAWFKDGKKASDFMELPKGNSKLEQKCRSWIANN